MPVSYQRFKDLITPVLYRQHRGFALVAVGMIGFHGVAAADHLLLYNRHTSTAWKILRQLGGLHFWGVVHACLFVILVVGLYVVRDTHLLAVRVAFALTLTVAMIIAGSFIWSAIVYDTSLFGVAGAWLAFWCSLAAILEPAENPLSHHQHFLKKDAP